MKEEELFTQLFFFVCDLVWQYMTVSTPNLYHICTTGNFRLKLVDFWCREMGSNIRGFKHTETYCECKYFYKISK